MGAQGEMEPGGMSGDPGREAQPRRSLGKPEVPGTKEQELLVKHAGFLSAAPSPRPDHLQLSPPALPVPAPRLPPFPDGAEPSAGRGWSSSSIPAAGFKYGLRLPLSRTAGSCQPPLEDQPFLTGGTGILLQLTESAQHLV